jgi:subtilisin family serine protease
MKKLFTLLLAVSLSAVSSFGQSEPSSFDGHVKITDQNPTSILGDLSSPKINTSINTKDEFIQNNLIDPNEKDLSSNYKVIRGERPPINLQAMPNDAFEKGMIKIKLNESFTNQMDDTPVSIDDKGYVVFNINSIDQLNQRFGPSGFDKLFRTDPPSSKFYDRHRAWGFHLWYTLYFDENTDVKELVSEYSKLSEVSIAEPFYKSSLHSSPVITDIPKSDENNSGQASMDWTPNDPSFNVQWHYHNTGQQSGTVDADIDLPEAWNIERGNSDVIVSIHDMGVQYNHPDLNGNMWINQAEQSGTAGVDDDGNGYVDDIYGYDFYHDNGTIEAGYHGTHVAGTVAAESNNGIGVSGVAGGTGSNDGVRLMSCMVYYGSGSGIGHHLAPVYAADNGACIDQNSWGYNTAGAYDQAVLDAIDYFNANGGGDALTGGITIYSAGNSNSSGHYYPGYYSGTLSVAATNNQDIKSYYSNYGSWIDISAPGGETISVTERGVYSTYTTSTYDYLQGTSMACPHVSGTAALIVSMAYGQLMATDVKDILINTTDDIDATNPGYIGLLGSGRLNAYQALLETQSYMVTPGTMMPIPGQTFTYTGNTRGYWFTAPTDFTVTGLRVPIDNPGDQTIEIIRFNSGPPPTWAGTTNDFVSLGRWVSVSGSGIISCNIPVSNGDVIGILGCRGTTNSYGTGPYSTNIDGHAVTLTRMGMQHQLPSTVAQDIWQENDVIGRIEMYYETFSTWTGNVNTSWTNTGNWSGGFVPDETNDVVIPTGCPNYPELGGSLGINTGSYTYACKSLTINSGATVTTNSSDIYTYGDLTVDGTLYIGDDFTLYSGSTVDLSGTISIGLSAGYSGEAHHNTGSVFNQTGGNYHIESIHLASGSQFNGTGGITHIFHNGYATNNNIEIDDPDSYFSSFYVDAGASAALYNCSYDLEVNWVTKLYGLLDINTYTMNSAFCDVYSGGEFIINSGGTVNITGNGPYFHDGGTLTMDSGNELNSGSNIRFYEGSTENVSGGEIFLAGSFTDYDEIFSPTGGSLTFDGGSLSYINGPTAFYNLNIDKTAATVTASSAFSIANDLVINSGVLDPANYTLEIGGDWTNNVGPVGFTEGTGLVIFNGAGLSAILTDETFYNLTQNNTNISYMALSLNDGLTATILNDLNLIDGRFELQSNSTLIIGDDVYIAFDSGLNAWGETGLEIFVGGNWTNDNTGWNTGYGYSPGTEIITFNGSADQIITTNADREDFGNLVIDKPSGEFRSNDSINVMLDFSIDHGVWHDNVSDLTHYFQGDFYIVSGSGGVWNSLTGNTVVFKGTADQTVFNTFGVGYFKKVIVDKTDFAKKKNSYSEGSEIAAEGGNLNTLSKGEKAMMVNLISDLDIQGSGAALTIEEGTLNLNGNIFWTMGDININDGGKLIVDDGALLRVYDGDALNVNAGGILEAIGSSGNNAKISNRLSGYYSFSILAGGTISANEATFEYMDVNGVYVQDGATIDPANAFTNCTFQNGTPGWAGLLGLNSNQTLTLTGLKFPTNTPGTQFNVWKLTNVGNFTLVGYTGPFSGPMYEYDGYERVHWSDFEVDLDLTVMLEGPYNGTNMNTDLSAGGYIPLAQPFAPALPYYDNAMPNWYYAGGEAAGSIPPTAVDWVLVQLRDSDIPDNAGSSSIVAAKAGFVLSDGSVVDVDGSSNLVFTVNFERNLYAVVYQRNHLGVISNYPINFTTGNSFNYNFSTGMNQAFGGVNGHKQIDVGVWGMVAADGNGNGLIQGTDETSVWKVDLGSSGYLGGDFSLNGLCQGSDETSLWKPNLGGGGAIPAKTTTGYESQIPK